MSYLFHGFEIPYQQKIVENIVNELPKADIINDSSIDYSIPNHNVINLSSYYNKLVNNDVDIIDESSLLPLDAELLEKMSFYEAAIYDLLDRYEFTKGGNDCHKRKNLYLKYLRFVNDLFKKHDITLVFMANIPHLLLGFTTYGYCKANNIPVIMWYSTTCVPYKLVGGYLLNDIYNQIPELEGKNETYSKEEKEYSEYSSRVHALYEKYMPQEEKIESLVVWDQFMEKTSVLDKIKTKINNWNNKASDLRLVDKFRYHYRLHSNKTYLKNNVKPANKDIKYLYFPLHYQPECTSMPLGGVYVNQLLVIKMISSLLPDDVMLYVKPHPNPSRVATKAFYKEIAECRNTLVIGSNVSTYDLMDNALATITLTGTAAIESIIRQRPVLMFGYFYYQYAPGVYHVKTIEECKKALDVVLKNIKVDKNQVLNFLSRMDDFIIDGYLDDNFKTVLPKGFTQEENIENLSKGFIDYLKKIGIISKK